MKVYDIISEVTPQYNPGAQARRAAMQPPPYVPSKTAPTATLSTSQKADARSAKTTANMQRLDRLRRQGKIGPVNAAYGKLIQQLKGKAAVKDIWDTAKNVKSAAGSAKLATFMKNIGGPVATFIRYVSLADIIKEYYDVIGAIEEAHQNGDLSEDPAESQTIFKSYVSQINGVLSAKLLAWYLAKKTSFTIAKWVARLIRWAVGATGTIATAGVGLAAVVASEGFFIWLERWLDSDQGRDWLLNGYIGMAIINLGKIEGSVYDSVTGYYQKQEKAKAGVQNKKAVDTAATPADKAAAQQKIDAEKAAQDRSDDIDALQAKLK